jgi:hypothetical protein
MLRRSAALLALVAFASLAHGAEGGARMEQTLSLLQPLKAGGSAWLEVQVGPLAPGQRVRVTTSSGELIGAIAPFGPAQRGRSGVYSLPVPPDAIHDGALSVHVTVTQSNVPPRAPTPMEIQSLRLRASDKGGM